MNAHGQLFENTDEMDQAKAKKRSVFVIDDDTDIDMILSSLLTMENFSVMTFTSGKSAVQKVNRFMPDIILLDYLLPGEKPDEVVSALRRASRRNLPIILMSAHGSARKTIASLGIKEFIEKPFQRESVLKALRKNLS